MKKLIIIGIDGATFDLIDPWIKGELPTFQKVITKGSYGKLKSIIPLTLILLGSVL